MIQADKTTPSKASHTEAAPQDAGTRCSNVSPEERQQMIATAAYYRAECRGFAEGCELEDWLVAEGEIDQSLKHGYWHAAQVRVSV